MTQILTPTEVFSNNGESTCFLCHGRALISWTEIRWGIPYTFQARCNCRAVDWFCGIPLAEDVLSPFELEALTENGTPSKSEQTAVLINETG